MMDEKGRVWFAAAVRRRANPGLLQEGLGPSVRQGVPARRESTRQLGDARSGDQEIHASIDTCFATHHLQFGYDADNTLWLERRPAPRCVGWINTKMYDETGDEAKAQGWTPFVLDTNGNGKRDDYVEPNQPVDPTKDKRIRVGLLLRSMPSPADGSIWGTRARLSRVDRAGRSRLRTRPRPRWRKSTRCRCRASAPRGVDIDSKASCGWRSRAAISAASTAASARARSTARPPTGKQCPEGWTLYPFPGPQLRRRHRQRQRRDDLLHLGRPAQHARPRQQRARSRPATATTR